MSKLDDFFSKLDEEGYRGECWILSREELDDRRRRLVEALGFTREHVEMLREEGQVGHPDTGRKLIGLADLIEALVKPESAPEEGGEVGGRQDKLAV